jgi:4-amino-4-deoxy-L-arabinose transferase-like glycosyltransferase
VFAAAGTVLIILHLAGLGAAPPGLYNDEASIGYNAWAIAHTGMDEHAVSFPLFFEAFGEYKNPVYIYALAPLTWVLPLTSWVVRLPAALSGLGVAAVAAGIGWRLSHSRAVALAMLVCGGLEPWIWSESRVAFEPIVMVLFLLLACLALVRAVPDSESAFALAGIAIALSAFSYTTGRAFGVLILIAIACSYARSPFRRWWCVGPPVAVAYGVLALWNRAHPGALFARYDILSVGADGAPLTVQAGRAIANYVQYIGVPFLFTHGDANPRHSSGYGGMLSVVLLPVLLVGLVVAVRRWREPLYRFTVLGLLAAPLSASVTAEGTPHSLRAATMLPFLLMLLGFGFTAVPASRVVRPGWIAVAGAVLGLGYASYLQDYFLEYPGRSVAAWDTGEGQTIARAHDVAGGRHVYLSQTLDAPYIQALFFLRPAPSAGVDHGLASLGMSVTAPAGMAAAARPGDIVVLAPGDPVPGGATAIADDRYTVTRHDFDVSAPHGDTVLVLAQVYRVGG